MSALLPHARAMRVLGEEWLAQYDRDSDGEARAHAIVYLAAADRLDAEIKANAGNPVSGAPIQFNPNESPKP